MMEDRKKEATQGKGVVVMLEEGPKGAEGEEVTLSAMQRKVQGRLSVMRQTRPVELLVTQQTRQGGHLVVQQTR
jgi:hypothetical protein